MAFIENFAQAVAAFFRNRIFPFLRPLIKKLYPASLRIQKFFKPAFDYLKVRPILTLILIGVLYFIGIAAVLYPMAGNIYSLSNSRITINQYDHAVEKMDESEIKRRFKNAEIYNTDLANGIYNDGYERA